MSKGASTIEIEKCEIGKCQFDTYKVGGVDNSGREIEQIVYYEMGNYIIYYVKGEYLRVYFANMYGEQFLFEESFLQLLGEIRAITIDNVKENAYVRQSLAIAYFDEVNSYHDVAIGELIGLKKKLTYKSYTKWLIAYMVCNVCLLLVCLLGTICSKNSCFQEITCCIASSCIGSFLVYVKKENEKLVIHYMPIVDAVISFSASCVSGFIVYCILQTNLVFGSLTDSYYSMIIICFVSGYSEDIPLKLLKSVSDMLGGGRDGEKNK